MTDLHHLTTPRLNDVPRPDAITGLAALHGIRRRRSILGALEMMHAHMGDVFRLTVPGFNPIVLVGPQAARFVLVKARDELRWRMENEPIQLLLRHGLLMEDGESHDTLRRVMNPALHRRMLVHHVEAMRRAADQVADTWRDGRTYNMLDEMRKIALLVLTDTLFGVDFTPEMRRLWPGVLRAVSYISPGPWVLWRGLSPIGYDDNIRMIDDYLYTIIAQRRRNPNDRQDLLGVLINADLDDGLIRDQLITMLIAGHDTSTASLAWTLAELGAHPAVKHDAQAEIDAVTGGETPAFEHLMGFGYLGQAIDETLRLHPPIHLGSRVAADNLEFDGYHIPKDSRVLYSIYLTHRHPDYWRSPNTFDPSRFDPGKKHAPYAFLPFGGGPRNCIGAAFAQVEVKVVMARLLQRFDFKLLNGDKIRPHMGATLEPRPGVMMRVRQRKTASSP